MATDTKDEVAEVETRPTNTNAEIKEAEPQPELVWDDEARGLCVRVYGDGSKSFLLVYRIDDRQRFTRIGETPVWSLQAARKRAKELRSIVDQGHDPASYSRERDKVGPVEDVIRYIAEHLETKP